MGFTTGFTGGVTLTLSIAYLTVLAHERNRQSQAHSLRSQSRVLTSLLEPSPLPPPQSRAELAREERSTLIEAAKDRWNDEVENAVRWVQRTDWEDVRIGLEGAVARVLGGGLEKSREGIESAEKNASPIAQAALEKTKAAGSETKEVGGKIAAAVKEGKDKAISTTETEASLAGQKAADLSSAAKARGDRAVADTKSGAHDAADSIRRSGGTVDAARGALRDAVGAGIEKGKEVFGKAQAAVGLGDEKSVSAVEKALHERYEKSGELEKSVEQVLAERYKPVDQRDNTVLRGV